ncbi:MAG: DegT/DnrJ/EryC1/StrS family aminotransferase [bacterium]|nr:DegT/DnrJ/EryC1/StrS family aminotransferase [bacterium]
MIPLSEPSLGVREQALVQQCLQEGWVSAEGPWVGRFEEAVASLHGPGMHAAACGSGTAALQLALIALGLRPGELVIVPALSFAATLNPIIHLGAEPVILDVEEEALGLSPEAVRLWLERETVRRQGAVFERRSGRRVFGLIPVHLYGMPCRIHDLSALALEHGLIVVEDNAEALGAFARGCRPGTFGHAAILSFNGNKTMTAGGGGMVLSPEAEIAERAAYWANQARRPGQSEPEDYGFNLRLSSLQAALGLAQLERLDELVAGRRRQHEGYRAELADSGLSLLEGHAGDEPSWWLNIARGLAPGRPETLVAELAFAGIQARRLFRPFDRWPLYAPYARMECRVAFQAHECGLALPSSSHLADEARRRVSGFLATARRVGRAAMVEALP